MKGSVANKRFEKLKKIIKKMRRVVVAYSGGVDSTFLLYAARTVLGKENVLAVTAISESYPKSEKNLARETARRLSANHLFIRTKELGNKEFRKNPVNRCYFCKKELFGRLNREASKRGYSHVLDGSTVDDLSDMRYGRIAAKEERVRSPIQEAGLTKNNIRIVLKKKGLDVWDKPSFACLASRFSYNQEITRNKLLAIGNAEEYMKNMGFRQLRVRCHNSNIIRIEVPKKDINKFLKPGIRNKILRKIKSLGFTYVTLDLEGFRTGSMNEGLPSQKV